MSKWMKNKEQLFNKFVEEKKKEKENTGGINRAEIVWPTPEKGTIDRPNTYVVRLLMDPKDNFYKSYHYHMFYSQADEKWNYSLCPKTFDFSNYCPLCAASSKLYLGSKADKAMAYQLKKKQRHVSNILVVKDPRDDNKIQDEKAEGKVMLYEFPSKVESKVKNEMNDTEYGAGMSIFDPGADGFDFVLKVGATKPIQEEGPNKGKSFPNYDDSQFAKKPRAISDSDDAIEQIMEKRHDLDNYLKTMIRDPEFIVNVLKKEMLWDLVKDEAIAKMSLNEEEEKFDEPIEGELNGETPDEKADEKSAQEKASDETDNDDDDDFLNELDEIGDDDIPF